MPPSRVKSKGVKKKSSSVKGRRTKDGRNDHAEAGRRLSKYPRKIPNTQRTYRYLPLQYDDSIRVLDVLPRHRRDSALHVKLRLIRLCDVPDRVTYEAVSYTWATEDGDVSLCRSVVCDGKEIAVTRNCESLLRQFRKSSEIRTLWVDAICIDQSNINERSRQVQLMQDVYSCAESVLIWLGDPSKLIDEKTLQPVSQLFLEYEERTFNPDFDKDERMLWQMKEFAGDVGFDIASGLSNVACRRWWTRIWVIQEVALARRAYLCCGSHCTDFWRFLESMLSFEKFLSFIGSFFASIPYYSHYLAVTLGKQHTNGGMKHGNFAKLLTMLRFFDASNELDYIYGIRGLLISQANNLPAANYSTSPLILFREVYATWQKNADSLEMLYQAIRPERQNGWPSWLPRWSERSFFEIPLDISTSYTAAASTIPELIFLTEEELVVKGYWIDTILRIDLGNLDNYGCGASRDLKMMGLWKSCKFFAEWVRQYQQSNDISLACRTFSWGAGVDALQLRSQYGHKKDILFEFDPWYHAMLNLSYHEVMKYEGTAQKFMVVASQLKREPFFVTGSGRLGSVLHTAQPGDRVVILKGGGLPFVLRPVGDKHELVGCCYIDELNDGREFEKHLDELQSFTII